VENRWAAARCGRRARVRVRSGGRGGGAAGGGVEGCWRTRRRERTEEEEERRRRDGEAASMVASPEGEPRGRGRTESARVWEFSARGFRVVVFFLFGLWKSVLPPF
jgi:hypothetical protein